MGCLHRVWNEVIMDRNLLLCLFGNAVAFEGTYHLGYVKYVGTWHESSYLDSLLSRP